MAYCKKDRQYLNKLRAAYEGIVGRKYSDIRWREIRRMVLLVTEAPNYFDESFAVALLHHAHAVRLKKKLGLCAKHKEVMNQVLVLSNSIDGNLCWEFGENLIKHLRISPPRSTKYWFFKKIGGYEPYKELSQEDKIALTFTALNWKINNGETNSGEFIKKA